MFNGFLQLSFSDVYNFLSTVASEMRDSGFSVVEHC